MKIIISIIVFVLFFVILAKASYFSIIESDCAALGYPSAKLTVDFTPYCIKRVDQTDVVVRLKDIK